MNQRFWTLSSNGEKSTLFVPLAGHVFTDSRQVVVSKSVGDVIAHVVEHVRFPLMPAATLTKIESENEKKKVIPERLISRAWKYHATKAAEENNAAYRPRAGTKI